MDEPQLLSFRKSRRAGHSDGACRFQDCDQFVGVDARSIFLWYLFWVYCPDCGQTGNQAVSPYQTLVRMSDVPVAFGDALNIGYAPSNMANKKLKWETTTQYDAGLDVGLFDEKLRLTLDYYYKITTDLLARVDLPPSGGFTSSTQNIGSVSNRGFELQIDSVPFTGNFQWDISANFYTNRNEIIELSKGADVFAPGL